MQVSLPVWRLKKGSDRRFQSGHPWIFSNELQVSPKGIEPGAPVELQDASGSFLAYGFGNPQSLIAFREMSRNPEDKNWESAEYLEKHLREAFQFREMLGLGKASFRWIHGESDGFSGLIVDRYLLSPNIGTTPNESVLVIQCHSSGMDRVSAKIMDALRRIDSLAKKIVVRNDVSSRKLEGLVEEVLYPDGKLEGDLQSVLLRRADGKTLPFLVDLNAGQKTGFFLDQTDNIQNVLGLFLKGGVKRTAPVKVLDLCTYVGQWSAHFAAALKDQGMEGSFTLVDVSEKALKIAKKNVEAFGFPVKTQMVDVLKSFDQIQDSYDVIICDPPALIQNRKHHPQGIHAYGKLNRDAMKLLKDKGLYVSCSCSQLLSPIEFSGILAKAEKTSKSKIRWVLQSSQAVDHPLRMDFPEGHYLKMQVGFKASLRS